MSMYDELVFQGLFLVEHYKEVYREYLVAKKKHKLMTDMRFIEGKLCEIEFILQKQYEMNDFDMQEIKKEIQKEITEN